MSSIRATPTESTPLPVSERQSGGSVNERSPEPRRARKPPRPKQKKSGQGHVGFHFQRDPGKLGRIEAREVFEREEVRRARDSYEVRQMLKFGVSELKQSKAIPAAARKGRRIKSGSTRKGQGTAAPPKAHRGQDAVKTKTVKYRENAPRIAVTSERKYGKVVRGWV